MFIIPVKFIITEFIQHVISMVVVFVIILILGYRPSSISYEVIYYMLCSFCILSAYGLFVSAITVLFRDFQKLMISVIRLLFYLSPVLWSYDNLEPWIRSVLNLNPFAYIISGYRNCILYGVGILDSWQQGCCFWAFTIILFVLGCSIHMRFRNRFNDLI